MNLTNYPDVVDASLVGTYSPVAKSGGYVWDHVLEYRVRCQPAGYSPGVVKQDE